MTPSWPLHFRYFVLIVISLVLAIGLWLIREIFTALIITGLLTYILNPAVELLMNRTRLSRRGAVPIIYFLSLIILGGIPVLLAPILADEIRVVAADLESGIANMEVFLSKPIQVLGVFIYPIRLLPGITEFSVDSLTPFAENALQLFEAASRNLAWVLVIMVSTYYLLLDFTHLRAWVFHLIPELYRSDARRLYDRIKQIWRAYLRVTLSLMLIVAIVFSIIWVAIGLPGGLLLGILTGLFSIIPELGPAIAAIIAVLVALLEGSHYLPISNFWFALLVLGIYLLLINLKGIWLRPRIMGRSVHMHEGLVFAAIIAAVIFQGILGALIIVPVLASAGILGRYVWQRILGEAPFPAHSQLAVSNDPPIENKS